MRFEFAIAAKYLVPRIKQFSVSIISLISILVISLVVWLILVFLSITDGLEKNWIDKLVSLNAPMRLTPTEAYYDSYYYKIDALSEKSSYRTKSIQEKLLSEDTHPYDPQIDPELPEYFPVADLQQDIILNTASSTTLSTTSDKLSEAPLKDIVKETFASIHSLKNSTGISSQSYEVGIGQYRIQLSKNKYGISEENPFIGDTSYVASLPETSKSFHATCLSPTPKDLQNVLEAASLSNEYAQEDAPSNSVHVNDALMQDRFSNFFANVDIQSLRIAKGGFVLPSELIPTKVRYLGIALLQGNDIIRFIIPKDATSTENLENALKERGYTSQRGVLRIKGQEWSFIGKDKKIKELKNSIPIVLDEGILLKATVDRSSLKNAKNIHEIYFHVHASIQNKEAKGRIPFTAHLELGEITARRIFTTEPMHTPFWLYEVQDKGTFQLPTDPLLGEGVLLAKSFHENGVHIGDAGYLSYQAATVSSLQEQRIPIFVAGFYDPGIIPLAGKIILARPEIAAIVRSANDAEGNGLGNGIQVWFDDLNKTQEIKASLEKSLTDKGLAPYWKIETFQEYEFSKDLVQQLKSDKNLFSLLAIIIITVACSNIISMLILLVNDKKKEIGILQSMGASAWNIALIFGTCGMILGLVSSLLGTLAAYFTLHHIDILVNVLSTLQGFDAFNAAFYGDTLPNKMSPNALGMVWIATSIISLLAGLVPAIKASLLKPAAVLRSE